MITRDLKVIRRRGKIRQPWRYADEEESENRPISYSHLISLLGVESKRVCNLLSTNNYIKVLVQKRGIMGVPWTQWCGSKGDLAVLWLDFTDAYESIPQKMVKVGLERHYILRRWGKKKHPGPCSQQTCWSKQLNQNAEVHSAGLNRQLPRTAFMVPRSNNNSCDKT